MPGSQALASSSSKREVLAFAQQQQQQQHQQQKPERKRKGTGGYKLKTPRRKQGDIWPAPRQGQTDEQYTRELQGWLARGARMPKSWRMQLFRHERMENAEAVAILDREQSLGIQRSTYSHPQHPGRLQAQQPRAHRPYPLPPQQALTPAPQVPISMPQHVENLQTARLAQQTFFPAPAPAPAPAPFTVQSALALQANDFVGSMGDVNNSLYQQPEAQAQVPLLNFGLPQQTSSLQTGGLRFNAGLPQQANGLQVGPLNFGLGLPQQVDSFHGEAFDFKFNHGLPQLPQQQIDDLPASDVDVTLGFGPAVTTSTGTRDNSWLNLFGSRGGQEVGGAGN